MAVCQHFHAIAMDGKRYGGSRKPGIFKNGRRYGRFNSMAESAKSLWTKIRYGERQCFPDLRYGRKNRMAVLVFFWTCAMDVSVLWPNPYNRYGRKTLWRIPKTQISKNQLALWTFRLYGRRPSVSAMDVHNAGHSGMADRPNRYGRP